MDSEKFREGSQASPLLVEQRRQFLEQKRKIEDSTIKSSLRSISLLHGTEKLANATANQLLIDREKLENTDKMLDDIHESLQTSGKHIKGLKSPFGRINNYFSGNKNENSSTKSTSVHGKLNKPPNKHGSELSKVLESQNPMECSLHKEDHSALQRAESSPNSEDVDKILDKHLEEISNSLSTLKEISLGYQQELGKQNYLIDTITEKTDRANSLIGKQDKELKKIIKK